MQVTEWIKSHFHLWQAQTPPLPVHQLCLESYLKDTLGAGAFPPLLISKVPDLTSGDSQIRRNEPRLQLPETLKNQYIVDKKGPKQIRFIS